MEFHNGNLDTSLIFKNINLLTNQSLYNHNDVDSDPL